MSLKCEFRSLLSLDMCVHRFHGPLSVSVYASSKGKHISILISYPIFLHLVIHVQNVYMFTLERLIQFFRLVKTSASYAKPSTQCVSSSRTTRGCRCSFRKTLSSVWSSSSFSIMLPPNISVNQTLVFLWFTILMEDLKESVIWKGMTLMNFIILVSILIFSLHTLGITFITNPNSTLHSACHQWCSIRA